MNPQSEQQGGELYKAASEELTGPNPSPEDREISEEMLAGQLETFIKQHGEIKGHLEYEDFLFELIKQDREKVRELLEERKI